MYQYFDEELNVMIIYMALPVGINECVTPNEDGTYTIFISTDICEAKQKEAFSHALRHINNRDFEKVSSVGSIERECHGV